MSQFKTIIADFYNRRTEDEWRRLERHRTEFAVTRRALETYLPPPPARLLDCGGGPGRYAIPLALQGYEVTLFDLSVGNLDAARLQAGHAGARLAAYEQGTATDLSRFADASFDAVLLLGPLYHLLEEPERRQAIVEAHRVLKPGGVLFAAFISRYAAHRDAAVKDPLGLLTEAQVYQEILSTGKLYPPESGRSGFVAYFAEPTEVAPLFWDCGLEVRQVLGTEGLISMIEDRVNALEGEAWERWLDLNAAAAGNPSILGACEHLLVVAVKPAWRAALLEIASTLDREAIPYTVSGGASIVLHGLPLPVKDVDLEMSPEDAYRFGDLFAGRTVEPVRWSESSQYRSHFGRFDFSSVTVEVMGGVQRRQGDKWVDTFTRHREVVDLDGSPVWASWLEEETLANIRRGRMDRAAECLRRCNPERLAALIRGEVETGVI